MPRQNTRLEEADIDDLLAERGNIVTHECKSRSNNPSLKRPICSAAPESNCGI